MEAAYPTSALPMVFEQHLQSMHHTYTEMMIADSIGKKVVEDASFQ
jgi:hypothetical protein